MGSKQFFAALGICKFLFFSTLLFSQVPKKYFDQDSITEEQYSAVKMEFGKHKKIPASIEKPVLIALSYYPELKNTPIRFRIKKRHTLYKQELPGQVFLKERRSETMLLQ